VRRLASRLCSSVAGERSRGQYAGTITEESGIILMKRSMSLLAGAVLATTVLAACGDDDSSGSGSTGDYCAKIATYVAKSEELDSVFTGTPDPAKIEDAFTTMQAMVSDLKSDAPAEIKADVTTMSSAIDSVVEIFSQYDWDLIALASAPEFATLQQELQGADMTASSDRLQAFSQDTCGIESETSTT